MDRSRRPRARAPAPPSARRRCWQSTASARWHRRSMRWRRARARGESFGPSRAVALLRSLVAAADVLKQLADQALDHDRALRVGDLTAVAERRVRASG